MKNLLLSLCFLCGSVAAQPTVLMVGTSHNQLGDTEHATGVWLSELSHAYDEFNAAGLKVEFASVSGEGFPLDPGSLAELDESATSFLLDADMRALLSDDNVLSLSEASANQYDAVYLIGGHGVMWDFKGDERLDAILSSTYAKQGVLGAVCHGVAGLLTAENENGELIISKKKVTGFSDEEEALIELTDVVPFLLETELKQAGANYSKAEENFASFVVTDGHLVTGQNPASATGVAAAMVELLIQ